MITFEEALSIIRSVPVFPETEAIGFSEVAGRVLASDVYAVNPMPPFDKSAVDGFACRSIDVGQPLRVIGMIAAGESGLLAIEPGTCARIMTGAPVPDGADRILMIEDCQIDNDYVMYQGKQVSSNICFQGEDIMPGQKMLPAGLMLAPQHIAVLATLGKTRVDVFCKTRVGIISTGNELVEPDIEPGPGMIRNSNSWQLFSQVLQAGGVANYYGIASDRLDDTIKKLTIAAQENDLVLLSGGVSAGDFDFVPEAMKQCGFEILFDSVAVQPGRPTTLASNGRKYMLGLPGNPVSSFVQYHLLGRILQQRMSGLDYKETVITVKTGSAFRRKKAERKSFYPIAFSPEGKVIPLEYHGSAHINSLSHASGFIAMEQGVTLIEEGSEVVVRLI